MTVVLLKMVSCINEIRKVYARNCGHLLSFFVSKKEVLVVAYERTIYL